MKHHPRGNSIASQEFMPPYVRRARGVFSGLARRLKVLPVLLPLIAAAWSHGGLVTAAGRGDTVAVLDLDPVGAAKAEATALSERLREVFLKSRRFTMVNRSQMSKILDEQALQQTTCDGHDCLVAVGKLLGAGKLVTGKAVKIPGNLWLVSAQMMDVETAETLGFESIRVKGDLFQVLESGIPRLASGFTNTGTPQSESPSAASSGPAGQDEPEPAGEQMAVFPGQLEGMWTAKIEERMPGLMARIQKAAGKSAGNLHLAYSYYDGNDRFVNLAYQRLKGHALFQDIEDNSWSGFILKNPDPEFLNKAAHSLGVKVIYLYRVIWDRGYRREYESFLYHAGSGRLYKEGGGFQAGKDMAGTLAVNFQKLLFESEVDSLRMDGPR